MRIHLTLLLLLGLAPLFSAPAKAGDLIDLAIEVVNPDLKPARPVLTCAIKGKPIKDCALAEGKKEFAENEDVQRILKVYNLAKNKQWSDLVAEVGLTVACTAFEVPGSALVCNEFGAKVAEYGAKAVKLAAEIHKQIGEKLLNSVKNIGKKIGCVTGIYCKKQDKKDPNKFYWSFGSTTLSMPKFDLGAIWKADYASRMAEGINARLNDPAKLQRMIAVPPPRMTAADASSAYAQFLLALKDPMGGNKPGGNNNPFNKKKEPGALITADDLKYFLAQDALAAKSMNDTTTSWFLTGATGDLSNVHLGAFEPFQREMNQRWLAEVNKAAGEMLEQPAQDLVAAQEKWRTQLMGPIAVKYFDGTGLMTLKNIAQQELAPCRAEVESPAVMLVRWGNGASAAGNDTTMVAGRKAKSWAGAKDWCSKTLTADMAARRADYDAAISWGCTPKTGRTAKGLDCPEKAIPKKPKFDAEGNWTSPPKGDIVPPVELCYDAYRVNDVVNPAYCSVNKLRAPGVTTPTQPIEPVTSIPGLAPPPSGRSQPTFPPIREQAPPQKSTLCLFDAGPRAGERQDYAPMAPLPVGSSCQDGRGSSGWVVAPQTRQSEAPQMSTLCLFDAGPRAGERQDYAPMAPIPVGKSCQDGRGSSGKVVAP